MSSLARPQRRWQPRHLVRSRCQVVRLSDFRLIGERMLDLSTRGALLACDEEVAPGQTFLLSFRTPWLGPWIDVSARVERVVEGWREGDPGYAAGVEFIDLTPRQRAELERRLCLLPDVPAARPRPVDYAETVRRIGLGRPRGLRSDRPRRISIV